MSTISFIQKVFADEDTFYFVSIPNTVIGAIKQRKRLPKQLYVHWMFFPKSDYYYILTLGTSRGKNRHALQEDNSTKIPNEIEEYIKMEEEFSNLEATAISWKITKWYGRTIALAKILFGYGNKIKEKLSYKNTITITQEIKSYMNLQGRTHLYWKHIDKNTWLVSKDRKDYDAITWHTWDEIKLPPAVMKELGFYTGAEVEIEFSNKNDKPALILRTHRYTAYLEDFLNNTLEENGKGIEIYELYKKYLDYLKAQHKETVLDEFYYLISVLRTFHIIPHEIWRKLSHNPEMPYVISNYGLKTQTREGGDGNG